MIRGRLAGEELGVAVVLPVNIVVVVIVVVVVVVVVLVVVVGVVVVVVVVGSSSSSSSSGGGSSSSSSRSSSGGSCSGSSSSSRISSSSRNSSSGKFPDRLFNFAFFFVFLRGGMACLMLQSRDLNGREGIKQNLEIASVVQANAGRDA